MIRTYEYIIPATVIETGGESHGQQPRRGF